MTRYVAQAIEGGWEVYDDQESQRCGWPDAPVSMEVAQAVADFYNTSRCPVCPDEPVKPKRSRCPICKEWISYQPDHPGHLRPYIKNGKLVWQKRKGFFTPASLAFMGHMNTAPNHRGEPFKNAFYERNA